MAKERGRHGLDITWTLKTLQGLADKWEQGKEGQGGAVLDVTPWPAVGPSPEMEKTDGEIGFTAEGAVEKEALREDLVFEKPND